MSQDPERLLSLSSDADALERELLGSVRHVAPPEGAKDEAWRAIAGQIAIGAGAAVATGSIAAAAAKSSGSSLAVWVAGLKVAAAVAAASLAVGGGYLLLRSPSSASTPAVAPRAPSTALAPAPTSAPPVQPDRGVLPAAPVQAEAPARKIEPKKTDLLRAESARLTEARAQLRAGNAAAAQATLDKLHTQIPHGVLAQEREVLAIEVQYARGNVESARRRARAFIKAYPQSPHSTNLARFVD